MSDNKIKVKPEFEQRQMAHVRGMLQLTSQNADSLAIWSEGKFSDRVVELLDDARVLLDEALELAEKEFREATYGGRAL